MILVEPKGNSFITETRITAGMKIIELKVFPSPQRIFSSPKENGKSHYFSSIFLLLML